MMKLLPITLVLPERQSLICYMCIIM